MQSQPKPCVFESDLAPLLSAFVAEKQRMGFKYGSIEAYLKSFDTYLLGKDCYIRPDRRRCRNQQRKLHWINSIRQQTQYGNTC